MKELLLGIISVTLSLALVITFIRLVRGPNLADRVVALDLMSVVVMAFICLYSVRYNQPIFLDVAIIMALLTFIGTVAFAYYLERRT